MEWSTALPDWRERIVQGRSLVPCPPLFPAEAEAAMKVFRSLRLVDVAGSPRMGDIARAWITDFAGAIFGAYDAQSARRLINEFFLLISKKNSKSTTAADIMVTALLRNWRKSAEFIILAPTIEIANNSAGPAMDMVRHGDDEMRDLLRPVPHQRLIEHRATGATLRIVAADSEVVGGIKAAGVLIDELWLFGKKAGAENMLREATGGLASRPEGFVIALSTMSDEPPAGVFKQWLDRYRAIRDGRIDDPRSLGVLYEFPEEMIEREDYKRPEFFYVTNPNLGASVDEDYLLRELAKAEGNGAASLASFYAKHLNVEIGLRLRSDRWAGADVWQAAADVEACGTLDALIERCEVIVVGVDGGGLDDLLGVAVLGREKGTRRWLLWNKAWCHACVLERRKEIAPRLLDFQKEGALEVISDDSSADIDGFVQVVLTIDEAGLLPDKGAVGADPSGISEIIDALELAEFAADAESGRIIGVRQGSLTLNSTTKTAERRLGARTLVHAGSALMAWCVGNAKAVVKGNAVSIEKAAAGVAKIDPLMATFNAIALMVRNPEAAGPSVYETDEFFI